MNNNKWISNLYHNSSNFQFSIAVQFLSKLNINNDSTILDIGCGTGSTTNYIAENITKNLTIGIDNSRSMIEYARNNYKRDNLKFILANAEDFKYYMQFDNIVSFFCIPWIKNKQEVFNNIYKLMHYKSRLFILGSTFGELHTNLLNNLILNPKWKPFIDEKSSNIKILNDTNYNFYCLNSNITVDEIDISKVLYKFNNKDELFKFNLYLIPKVIVIQDSIKYKFIDELLCNYFKYIGEESYVINFDIIKLIANKSYKY